MWFSYFYNSACHHITIYGMKAHVSGQLTNQKINTESKGKLGVRLTLAWDIINGGVHNAVTLQTWTGGGGDGVLFIIEPLT